MYTDKPEFLGSAGPADKSFKRNDLSELQKNDSKEKFEAHELMKSLDGPVQDIFRTFRGGYEANSGNNKDASSDEVNSDTKPSQDKEVTAESLNLGKNPSAEEMLDALWHMKQDNYIKGSEVAKLHPELSKASIAVKRITRVDKGLELELTWKGIGLLKVAPNAPKIKRLFDNKSYKKRMAGQKKFGTASNKFYNSTLLWWKSSSFKRLR